MIPELKDAYIKKKCTIGHIKIDMDPEYAIIRIQK